MEYARADLTPIEEARAFQVYLGWDEQHHFEDGQQKSILTLMEGLAEKIPMSPRTIQNRLSILHCIGTNSNSLAGYYVKQGKQIEKLLEVADQQSQDWGGKRKNTYCNEVLGSVIEALNGSIPHDYTRHEIIEMHQKDPEVLVNSLALKLCDKKGQAKQGQSELARKLGINKESTLQGYNVVMVNPQHLVMRFWGLSSKP